MTEYDYSPAAIEAWRKKQDRISKWASNTSLHKHPSPFSPTDRPRDSDFYSKPSTPSEIYGPDRPPSPPRSAPPIGGFGYAGGGGRGYPAGGGYAGGPGHQPAGPSSPTVLVPRWNGFSWVYDTSNASSPRHSSPARDHHHQPRPKSHRRRSVSGPPATPTFSYPQPSAPVVSYNSNGARVNVVNLQPHTTSPPPLIQPRPQYYRSSSWQQPQRSSSLPMTYPSAQAYASTPPYGGQPIVIVDAPRRKSSKLRKGRY
ncbi:hypothetical protein NMY22_g4902 [Coprinellus aureogranulatus]|nr:hypothetical protein NMY22_g4902 [Coprinellus aureogranulatus]